MRYFPIRTICCVVLATLAAPTAAQFLALGHDPQRSGEALPRVHSFKCEGASMLEALLLLGQQEHVPLGIEYLNLEAVQKTNKCQFAPDHLRRGVEQNPWQGLFVAARGRSCKG
jgi:hypothetical protein